MAWFSHNSENQTFERSANGFEGKLNIRSIGDIIKIYEIKEHLFQLRRMHVNNHKGEITCMLSPGDYGVDAESDFAGMVTKKINSHA